MERFYCFFQGAAQHTSHLGTIADGRFISVNVMPGAAVHRGQKIAGLKLPDGAKIIQFYDQSDVINATPRRFGAT